MTAEGTVVSIRSIVTRPEESARLGDLVGDLMIFERARESGGLQNAMILRSLTRADTFLIHATWDDRASYDRWIENPTQAELAAKLLAVLREPLSGDVLRIVEGTERRW